MNLRGLKLYIYQKNKINPLKFWDINIIIVFFSNLKLNIKIEPRINNLNGVL